MWTRKELKSNAKMSLKGNYWTAFWVSLVLSLPFFNLNFGMNNSTRNTNKFNPLFQSINYDRIFIIVLSILAIFVLVGLAALLIRIFLGYLLEVGGRRYFIHLAQNIEDQRNFGFVFSKENYKSIIKTMLLRGVYNFLWYLLFFIPGIVKSYSYRMVPYILADNPNIGAKRAIELSIKMTRRNKFKMFVLDLSFIGWILLGFIAFFIGILFVIPYIYATEGGLYIKLREDALLKGLCSYDELLMEEPKAEIETEVENISEKDIEEDQGQEPEKDI